jgi:hypothetical protein
MNEYLYTWIYIDPAVLCINIYTSLFALISSLHYIVCFDIALASLARRISQIDETNEVQ